YLSVQGKPFTKKGVLSLDNREDIPPKDALTAPTTELKELALDPDHPKRFLQIGANLPSDVEEKVIQVLRDYSDVFAWGPEDMPGIDPALINHKLSIPEGVRPVKQKLRTVKTDKHIAISNEVEKLLNAGFIREVSYPEWLANVVMVKKSNGKWRMCVDFTDLNKACPKDCYPLPNIDLMVDSTAGHALLSFVDAYSGYHQIKMNPEDEEKTAFIVNQGTYCYRVMPFGLKNAGATFQRLVDRVFEPIRGRVVEAYVDDLVIKSKEVLGHPEAMKETFEILRQHRMKLNPSKCTFGVPAGKFLGFLVSERGIEANPDKIKAILEMKAPKNRKQIQSLNGKIAALGRFVARSGDKCLPFFKNLKKAKTYEWDDECDKAFEHLKAYLSSP
nr:reverse transcriptase family protein [Serratia marcescens]